MTERWLMVSLIVAIVIWNFSIGVRYIPSGTKGLLYLMTFLFGPATLTIVVGILILRGGTA